jgi:probable HAF family extracellular repeat protein
MAVGTIELPTYCSRATIWGGGSYVFVPSDAGLSASASACNDNGQVTGERDHPGGWSSAFVWQDGVVIDIPPIGPIQNGTYVFGSDISETGFVVGSMWIAPDTSIEQPFRWRNGRAEILPLLAGTQYGFATAVNNAGVTVGSSIFTGAPDWVGHAIVWKDGKPLNLGVLPQFLNSSAMDINDQGVVVGRCYSTKTSFGIEHAFIWHGGNLIDLNDCVIGAKAFDVIYRAYEINESGQITVLVRDWQGDFVSALLTPVPPEPADLDCNNTVGPGDLAILLSSWGACAACAADIDGNSVVNPADLAALLAAWD